MIMAHVVREVTWGVIDIVVDEGRIFFQERWQYNWLTSAGEKAWTRDEKRKFHKGVDNQIWKFWSNRIKFVTSGKAAFAKKHPRVPINFDVRWVLAKPHWTVSVRKLPAGSTPIDDLDPRISPSQNWSVFAFAAVDGRAVARDIFLDGNTWRDSPSVDKESFVGDFSYGIGLIAGRWQLTFTEVQRSREFKTQVENHNDFGSVTLSCAF